MAEKNDGNQFPKLAEDFGAPIEVLVELNRLMEKANELGFTFFCDGNSMTMVKDFIPNKAVTWRLDSPTPSVSGSSTKPSGKNSSSTHNSKPGIQIPI